MTRYIKDILVHPVNDCFEITIFDNVELYTFTTKNASTEEIYARWRGWVDRVGHEYFLREKNK